MVRFRYLFALLAAIAVMGFVIGEADARVGKGSSMGSRGNRTFSAPPPTNTAPTASPFQRSITQPNAARPSTPAGAPATGMAGRPGGMFGGGLLGGLAAGFIGAGLFGMLFGHGFMGGLGGFASILGLILQVGLVIIVARLAWSWWQRRQQPQEAYASGPSMRDNPMGSRDNPMGNSGSMSNGSPMASGGLAGMFGLGGSQPQEQEMSGTPIEISPQDYDTFERLLGEIQHAFSDEDLNALRTRTTPEMLSYFSEDLSDNASGGVINKISDVKLLQGDLAEAWSEGNAEYATVAMRFSLIDQVLDRATQEVVGGSATDHEEATEMWTFRRVPQGVWVLAGIQQIDEAQA
jgi:predicted lipid-binding transport protein (Tim44 family)